MISVGLLYIGVAVRSSKRMFCEYFAATVSSFPVILSLLLLLSSVVRKL